MAARKRIEATPIAAQESWFETPTMLNAMGQFRVPLHGDCRAVGVTYFCSHVQSCPAPMKLAPKHSILMADVARTAIHGI